MNGDIKYMEKFGQDITLYSEYSGKLKIGEYEIQCAVLNNGKHVFWQREVLGLLTGNTQGKLSRYFKAKNLVNYV